jgi:histidinol-phosphatase (PHP family)
MGYKNLLDLHTHTDNSFDGRHSAIFLCESAVERGLRAVAFTDHVEMDHFRDQDFDRTAKQSFFETAKACSAFRGQLIVCAGVELGEPTYNLPEAETLVRKYSYDVILGSVHNLRGRKDFCFLPYAQYSGEEIAALVKEYFDELLLLARWGKFDVLAHLTYPLRYICGEHGRALDITGYREQIDTVLEAAVGSRLALEINTSGLRRKLGKPMPEEWIVRRFRELGGQRVTVGSDAHYAHDLGAGLEAGMDLALRCGFTHVTLYQGREPVSVEIC